MAQELKASWQTAKNEAGCILIQVRAVIAAGCAWFGDKVPRSWFI